MARFTGGRAPDGNDGSHRDDVEAVDPQAQPASAAPAHLCACERDGSAPCFAAELRRGADIDAICKQLAL